MASSSKKATGTLPSTGHRLYLIFPKDYNYFTNPTYLLVVPPSITDQSPTDDPDMCYEYKQLSASNVVRSPDMCYEYKQLSASNVVRSKSPKAPAVPMKGRLRFSRVRTDEMATCVYITSLSDEQFAEFRVLTETPIEVQPVKQWTMYIIQVLQRVGLVSSSIEVENIIKNGVILYDTMQRAFDKRWEQGREPVPRWIGHGSQPLFTCDIFGKVMKGSIGPHSTTK